MGEKSATSGILSKQLRNKKINMSEVSGGKQGTLSATRYQNKITSVSRSCPADNEKNSVPLTVNMSSKNRSVKVRSNSSQVDSNKHSKSKRGRPKKSLGTPVHEDIEQPPAPKKPKLSGSTKLSVNKATTGVKRKASDCDRDLNALMLAREMGYADPYIKITIKSSGNDKDEEITKHISPIEIIQQAIDYRTSCKCTCLAELSIRDIALHRLEITLLDRQARDFFVMGLLRCAAVTFKETSRHHDRIRNRFSYRIMNTKICHCCFLMVNNIGGKYLKNLKKHFASNGVTSRTHGNSGRKPYHAIGKSEIDGAVEFVTGYAVRHGTPAARPPKNHKSKRVIKLPASENVTSVHKQYKKFYAQSGQRTLALTSFRKVWTRYLPHIKLAFKDSVSPAKTQTASDNVREPTVSERPSLPGHTTLKHMLNLRRDDTASSNNTAQPVELKTAVKSQIVNLPQDFAGGEISLSSTLPLNMYLNEGENQDGIQYSYFFSPVPPPVSQQLHTNVNTSGVSSSTFTRKANQGCYTTTHLLQHSGSSVTVNPSIIHLPAGETFHSGNSHTDKQYHLLSPGGNLDATSSQFLMDQLAPKNSVTVYPQQSDASQPSQTAQQNLLGSGHTTSNTQIHMPVYQ